MHVIINQFFIFKTTGVISFASSRLETPSAKLRLTNAAHLPVNAMGYSKQSLNSRLLSIGAFAENDRI